MAEDGQEKARLSASAEEGRGREGEGPTLVDSQTDSAHGGHRDEVKSPQPDPRREVELLVPSQASLPSSGSHPFGRSSLLRSVDRGSRGDGRVDGRAVSSGGVVVRRVTEDHLGLSLRREGTLRGEEKKGLAATC